VVEKREVEFVEARFIVTLLAVLIKSVYFEIVASLKKYRMLF